MTTKEIIHLQSLLCKMKPGPYEYWNEPGNDIIAAECNEGDGEPIAALAGIYSMENEFRAIAALLNASPELIKLALLANLNAAKTLVTEIAQGLGFAWTQTPPTETGVYWLWQGEEDSGAVPVQVYGNGHDSWVAPGQHGWTRAQTMDELENCWWMPCQAPELPILPENAE